MFMFIAYAMFIFINFIRFNYTIKTFKQNSSLHWQIIRTARRLNQVYILCILTCVAGPFPSMWTGKAWNYIPHQIRLQGKQSCIFTWLLHTLYILYNGSSTHSDLVIAAHMGIWWCHINLCKPSVSKWKQCGNSNSREFSTRKAHSTYGMDHVMSELSSNKTSCDILRETKFQAASAVLKTSSSWPWPKMEMGIKGWSLSVRYFCITRRQGGHCD